MDDPCWYSLRSSTQLFKLNAQTCSREKGFRYDARVVRSPR